MKDQVDNFSRQTGTRIAAALSGMLTLPERGEVLEAVRLGDVGILYDSPEQLRNHSFTPQPVTAIEEYFYEALSDQNRAKNLGNGIFLSTVHSVKGLGDG